MSPTIAAQAQRLRLEAASTTQLAQVSLWVDGVLVSRLDHAPYQAWWELTPGLHRAWAQAVLPDGQQITSPVVSFTVLE